MSKFEVKIVPIDAIEEIPGADRIEMAVIGDYRSIVKKHEMGVGEYVAYIPEGAVVPEYLLERLGLTGRLAGAQKNRVKAVTMQQKLSQGIVVPVHAMFGCPDSGPFVVPISEGTTVANAGDDVADVMGIIKYEPPIPASMSGEIYFAGRHVTFSYDIENIKKYPHAFVDGEIVEFTEKLHGTYCQLIFISAEAANQDDALVHKYHLPVTVSNGTGYFAIASKGRAEEGLCFHWTAEQPNVYIQSVQPYLNKIAEALLASTLPLDAPITIMGEVFGPGIQDLHYGLKTFSFRVFDVLLGKRQKRWFIDAEDLDEFCTMVDVPRVPVVYRGPYSKEVVKQYTDHQQSQFDANQISEGIVISPVVERYDASCGPSGRVKMKSVNVVYLMRKNKNATEFN
jgi:RNA ligase (TIGR02306 family)